VSVEIRRDVFAEKLREQLYSPSSSRGVPLIIHRAAHGDFAPFLKAAVPAHRSGPDFIADGMYLSVTCSEDLPFIDSAAAARLNKGNIFGNYRVEQQHRACEMWARGRIPSGYHQPVRTDIPVLIFSGYMDPVSPSEWGEGVARLLPNSRLISIRHLAHLPDGLAHMECLDDLILDFLSRGDTRGLDTSCVQQMSAPEFQIEVLGR
jgi:pimeloyl-ACP methyl ester carboxylesterase